MRNRIVANSQSVSLTTVVVNSIICRKRSRPRRRACAHSEFSVSVDFGSHHRFSERRTIEERLHKTRHHVDLYGVTKRKKYFTPLILYTAFENAEVSRSSLTDKRGNLLLVIFFGWSEEF